MVEFIEYKGQQYPFRLGYYALKMAKNNTGKDIEHITDNDIEIYEDLLYYALEAGHKVQDIDFNFEREEMPFVLDFCFNQFVSKVPNFFQGLGQTMEQANQVINQQTQTQAKKKSPNQKKKKQ